MIESLTGFLIFLHVRKYRVRNFFKKNVAIPVDMILWYSLFTRNTTSEWYSSGRVLGPLLFLIYVNDLIDHSGLYLDIYVFADDAKFFRHIMEQQRVCQPGKLFVALFCTFSNASMSHFLYGARTEQQ